MFDMNRCLLIATSFLYGVLTASAYCSCKCNTPEIPYTRVSYVPPAPVPHIPYKYSPVPTELAQVAVNPYIHQAPAHTNHQPNYVPIVIIPQVANPHLSNHLPLHESPTHNSLELQRKELILQDIGQSSQLQHVQISPQVNAALPHQLLASTVHGEAATSSQSIITSQHIGALQQDQVYQNLQTEAHAQLGDHGGGYDSGHGEHHKKNHHIHYKYGYSVNDHKTGDIKRHQEERHGDDVVGEYSLLEDDGNVRTVKYRADWKTGFHAQVHNSKPRQHG